MKGSSKAKTPQQYLQSLEEPRKTEITALHQLITETAPELKPHMDYGWLGYGTYHYRYASGREGTWSVIGLASQKNYISLYACLSDGQQYIAEKYKKELPKANIGKSCIRFKRLDDVDFKVLKKIIKETADLAKKKNYQFIS